MRPNDFAGITRHLRKLPTASITRFTFDTYIDKTKIEIQDVVNQDNTLTRIVIVQTLKQAEALEKYWEKHKLGTIIGALLLMTSFLPAWAINPDEPIELVSSERMGFRYMNLRRLQLFGPKRYTYRTRSGGNLQSLVHIKTVPDRRPSEQRHPIESSLVRGINYTLYFLNLKNRG